MDILVIEDDLFKYSKIEICINTTLEEVDIIKYDNVHDAVNYLNKYKPDKIVLDMSLPSHSAEIGEGSPLSMPAGGIEIILELNSLNLFNIPILILTQYPDVEIEGEYYSIEESKEIITSLYGMTSLHVLNFDNDSDEWQNDTKIFLRNK